MKKQSQLGMSSLSLLLVLIAVAFVLMAAFKIGPLYLDNYFVKSSVESLQDEKITEMSDVQIHKALYSRFIVNGVRDIDVKQALIERSSKGVVVDLSYEKRVNFIGNVDVVVIFNNRFDTSNF